MTNWQPATHSDQTDLAATQVDAAHAPLAFVLDEQDQAFVAAVRRCTRSHGEAFEWLDVS